MSDRTYLEAWQQAHREAGADMDRVIRERDEARAERDALAAQLEAARQAAAEVQRHWQYGHQTYLGSGVAALIRTLAAPVAHPASLPEPEQT